MRLTIPETANPNCYVFQMGYLYPVCVWNRSDTSTALKKLEPVFGEPSREQYFWEPNRVKQVWRNRAAEIQNRRWYLGQRLWRRVQSPKTDFWLVFRKESDRTLAMMLIRG